MNDQFRSAVRKLDQPGVFERAEQIQNEDPQQALAEAAEAYRDALMRVRKQEKQTPQQVAATSVQARERGLRSYDPARHREYDIEKLMRLASSDPATYFFLTRNTSPETA